MQNPIETTGLRMATEAADHVIPPTTWMRATLTGIITRQIACWLIAQPGFPCRTPLPRARPPVFHNFQHQLLFDYEKFVQIVWQVINTMKQQLLSADEKYRGQKKKYERKRSLFLWAAIATVVVFLILSAFAEFWMGALIGITIGTLLLTLRSMIDEPRSPFVDTARIRIEAIQKLLSDTYLVEHSSITIPRTLAGDGCLGNTHVPVITILSEAQPFTGYGKLQMDNHFVCRPTASKSGAYAPIDTLNQQVFLKLKQKSLDFGLPETLCGELVLLHGASLRMDSAWLDEHRAPRLWVSRDGLGEIGKIDVNASARVYFAIQFLFPRYSTLGTFFVRLYPAGNGIAFQILLSTLGPLEDKTHNFDPLRIKNDIRAAELHSLDLTFEVQDFTEQLLRELSKTASSGPWPGFRASGSGDLSEWRQKHSYAFTGDFFGRPESMTVLRTAYEQIVKLVLETLEASGYDVSDYRGNDGKYLINFGKIDQLMVGDKIDVNQNQPETKKQAPEAAAGVSSTDTLGSQT